MGLTLMKVHFPSKFLTILEILILANFINSSYSNSTLQTTPSNSSAILNFLVQTILEQDFQFCRIIVAYGKEEIKVNVNSSRTMPLSKNYWVIQSLLQNLSHKLRDIYLIDFMSPTSISPNSRNSFGSVSKHNDNCVLSIIFMSGSRAISPKSLKRLSYLLIPPTHEVTMKDEDYFLIVTENVHESEVILRSPEFGTQLKYKLALSLDSKGHLVLQNHPCFWTSDSKTNYLHTFSPIPKDDVHNVKPHFQDLTQDLKGYNFKISVPTAADHASQIHQVTTPGGGTSFAPTRGHYFMVMNHLSQIFNFTYEVKPGSGGGGSGLKLENGSWTGAIGDIVYGKADLVLVSGLSSPQRYKAMGYSFPVTWEWLTFTTSHPSSQFPWGAILYPFSIEVWTWILGAIVLLSTILWTLSHSTFEGQGRGQGGSQRSSSSSSGKSQLFFTVELIFGSILEQSIGIATGNQRSGSRGSRARSGGALQVIIGVWLLSLIILHTGYKSKLMTSLAFPTKSEPPNTYKELAASDYKIGFCYMGGSAYSLFQSSPNPTLKNLFHRLKLYDDITQCFYNSMSPATACIGFATMMQYSFAKNLTDLRGRPLVSVRNENSFFIAGCIGMRKRAVFRTNFNFYIQGWVDMGLISKWRTMDCDGVRRVHLESLKVKESLRSGSRSGETSSQQSESQNEVVVTIDDGSPQVLTLEGLKGIFCLLALGLGVATIGFLVEIVRVIWNETKLF